jgi:hypothetical protein
MHPRRVTPRVTKQTTIEPVPVISPLVLPAIIVLANAAAAFPARAAVHTQPAIVLRAE